MTSVVSEAEFRETFTERLRWYAAGIKVGCVTGPGRSGAIAAVYASHILGVPFIPSGQPIPDNLRPALVVDTAIQTGKTIRKAAKKADTPFWLVAMKEPPRVRFWYEVTDQRLENIT
jgi:hypothetical protein